MKITVTHETVYRYNSPVSLEPRIFRLRPRANSSQRLLEFNLQITPTPAGTAECLDQDGNLALNAWFGGATQELRALSRFRVELLRENPFDNIFNGDSLNLPRWYREPLFAALTPYRNDRQVANSVQRYAKSVAASAQWNALSFLAELSLQISRICRGVIRPMGAPRDGS